MRRSERWLFTVVAAAAIASCARAACIDRYLGDGNCDRFHNNEECGTYHLDTDIVLLFEFVKC